MLTLTRASGEDIRLPAPASAKVPASGTPVLLGIRPEAITDKDGADRLAQSVSMVDALVDVVEPSGADTFVVTRIAGKEVTARFRADFDVRPGQTVPLAFNLDKALLFDPASGMRL